MPARNSPTCSSFYHKRTVLPLSAINIKCNNYEWLYQNSAIPEPEGFLKTRRHNLTSNLFHSLIPGRSGGVRKEGESDAWLLRADTCSHSLVRAVIQTSHRGDRSWLLLDWLAEARPEQLPGGAFFNLISAILVARDPAVLHIMAPPELAPTLRPLLESSGSPSDPTPSASSVWSPGYSDVLRDNSPNPGQWFVSWQTSLSLWQLSNPDQQQSDQLQALIRLRKLKTEAKNLYEKRKKNTRRRFSGLLGGLRLFAGKRK